MYILILTLIVLNVQPEPPKAETSLTAIPSFATKEECDAAGQIWVKKNDLNVTDRKNWALRKSFVCSKASSK